MIVIISQSFLMYLSTPTEVAMPELDICLQIKAGQIFLITKDWSQNLYHPIPELN